MGKKSVVLIVVSLLLLLAGCSKVENKNVVVDSPTKLVEQALSCTDAKEFSKFTIDFNADTLSESELKNFNDGLNKTSKLLRENKQSAKFEEIPMTDEAIKDYSKVTLCDSNSQNIQEDKMLIFYVKKTDGQYKLDMKSSQGINNPTVLQYKAQSMGESKPFKLYAKLDDYYNYEFSGKEEQYYSIQLNEINSNKYINGYISKKSDDGKKLYEYLKDGRVKQVNLDLSIPNSIKKGNDIFQIDSVISTSWVTPEGK